MTTYSLFRFNALMEVKMLVSQEYQDNQLMLLTNGQVKEYQQQTL
jgi:hypothetical protein